MHMPLQRQEEAFNFRLWNKLRATGVKLRAPPPQLTIPTDSESVLAMLEFDWSVLFWQQERYFKA